MMKHQFVWWTCFLTLFLLVAGQAPAHGDDRVGVNVGWQNSLYRADQVVAESSALGAGTVRMDIRPSHSPSHYAQVVDKFRNYGIDVLVVFAADGFGTPINDAYHYSQHGFSVCNHYWPTNWGNAYVIPFLNAIQPYVDAIKNKSNLLGVEIWNEVTGARHHLCAADYAYLMTEAKLRWPSTTLGTSTESGYATAYSWQYMQKLNTGTDKVNWYKATHGGQVPWDVAMHHPYSPYHDSGSVNYNLWYHGYYLDQVQPRPVWFTEIGWKANEIGEYYQDLALEYAVDYTLWYGYADRIFWYQMYSCNDGTGDFGLRRDCDPIGGTHNRRPAWYSLRDRM